MAVEKKLGIIAMEAFVPCADHGPRPLLTRELCIRRDAEPGVPDVDTLSYAGYSAGNGKYVIQWLSSLRFARA